MKNRFTILTAAFALLAFLAVPLGMRGQTTYQQANSISVGDVVVITSSGTTTSGSFSKEMTGISTTSTTYGVATDFTTTPEGTYALTIEEGNGNNTYALRNGNLYLSWSSGNSLTTSSEITNASSWTIEFEGSNAIITNVGTTDRKLRYNSSSPRFACYTSAQTAIQLYKQVGASTDPEIQIAAEELMLSYEENLEGEFNVTYTNGFEPEYAFAQLYNDAAHTEEFDGDWISVEEDLDEDPTVIPYIVGANSSYNERTVYMYVEAMDSDETIISGVFMITQAAAPQLFAVNFNLDSDATFLPNEVFTDVIVELEAGTYALPSATKEGFTFDGWNDGVATYAGGANYTVSDDVDFTAQWTENTTPGPGGDEQWVLTNLADLTEDDVFVIVGTKGDASYAMSNDKGASAAPTAVAVTISNNMLTGTIDGTIRWTGITGNGTDGYTIYSNADNSKYLYCIGQNNGVRVGTGDANTFIIKDDYIYNTGQERYIGVYNNADWRCYTSIHANIAGQTFSFYKKVTGGVLPPSITAANVEISYDATNGSIAYTINNAPDPAGTLTASTESDWLTLGTVGETVPFTCSANEASAARTATVTLTYAYGDNQTVSTDVTVTQAAAPVIYTTIPALFAAATSTETSVLVTFNNWVVSGVSTNGKNVFVTDNIGNGFVIFDNSGNLGNTYTAGDVLAGTAVSCNLKKYNGFAELLNVSDTDLTITTGGTVSTSDIDMADLAGVNTGALVSYENLTCSVDNSGSTPKYYLSDGTTTIQVYNSLFANAYSTLEAGKAYNITGVYQQFNNTKEILPRSANDIVEVTAPAVPTITVTPDVVNLDAEEHLVNYLDLAYENIVVESYQSFTVHYYNAANEEIQLVPGEAWLVAGVVKLNDIYQVYYTVVANEGEARTAYLKVSALDAENNVVYSNLVTINQAAPVVPPTPGEWVMVSLTDLTENDVFVIVGVYDVDESSFAMPNNSTGAPSAVEVTIVDNTLSGDIDDNLKWNLGIGENGYTFYPDGETETWLYCTNTNNGVRVGTNENNVFSMTPEGYLFNNATERYIGIYNSQDWRCYTSINNNIKEQTFAFFKRVDESDIETYTLDIDGYGDSDGGYYLIASPVSMVRPTEDNGFFGMGEYDLYRFDQTQAEEWRNYKVKEFNLVSGKGYLYASQEPTTLTFTGVRYNGDGVVALSCDADAPFAGWNLIGNPYVYEANISQPYYRLNEEGNALQAETETESVNAMEGVFVKATGENQTAQFIDSKKSRGEKKGIAQMNIKVKGNYGMVDNAIVRFDNGETLEKFMLNANSTKLYITEGHKDYAIVRSNAESEMPINFKAENNGNYTISVNAENLEMNYLHLIDNMTGADVDLLVEPSYSFEAKTTDYASRFKLVFSTNSTNENGNETFAFFNGSEWSISNIGEATLQVVDVTGRIIISETVNGNITLTTDNFSAGVYVMRLVNGNNVKTQKVIVR